MLADHEVHLWSASIQDVKHLLERLRQTLSNDEREKASRFRFDADRIVSIVSRGLLRFILSHYTGVAPEKLRFSYGTNGKPQLCDSVIHFNVSHSGERVLYALAFERMLGVDIEYVRSLEDLETIAKQFFSPMEYKELLRLDENQRREAFFNCWTRKEAYVKAIGDGLSAPLDRFQVTLAPGDLAAFVSFLDDESLVSQWSLFALRPAAQYAGAIAIYGREWRVHEKALAQLGLGL